MHPFHNPKGDSMHARVRVRVLAGGLLGGLCLTACGGAATEVAEVAPAETVITTAMGAPGTFLTDGEGRTLYLFTSDTPDVSTCVDGCLASWPALLTGAEPVPGSGVDATLLGTAPREDGSLQVTYAGWPLYLFAGDAAPGDLEGQGVNDAWFVVSPAGEMLTLEPDVDSDTSSGGYGYGSDDGY